MSKECIVFRVRSIEGHWLIISMLIQMICVGTKPPANPIAVVASNLHLCFILLCLFLSLLLLEFLFHLRSILFQVSFSLLLCDSFESFGVTFVVSLEILNDSLVTYIARYFLLKKLIRKAHPHVDLTSLIRLLEWLDECLRVSLVRVLHWNRVWVVLLLGIILRCNVALL